MRRSRFILIGLIALAGCAKQGMPPGGPEDKTPPEIIETFPLPEALNVPLDTEIVFTFSESVQTKNIEEAFFVTPFSGESVHIGLRGRRLKVTFADAMEADRTYVITLGTAFTDYRNNPMTASYTLAFSTGDQLDQGAIAGRVYGLDKYTGVDVWAYQLQHGANPLTQDPDYIVQCGEDGRYAFSHLAPGIYRLFCVQDRLGDRRYQAVEDMAGITWRDAVVDTAAGRSEAGLNFQMMREDTLAPSLTRLELLPLNWLRLHFDKPMALPDSTEQGLQIQGAGEALPIESQFIHPEDPQRIYVHTAPQRAGKEYDIDASALSDVLGLSVDTAYAKTRWTAVAHLDTTAPAIVATRPGSGENHMALFSPISIDFSEPVLPGRDSLAVTDTLGVETPFLMRWATPMRLTLTPAARLKSRTKYQLDLGGARIADASGNALADTVLQWTTLNADTLSALSGRVVDSDSLAQGPVYITATQTHKNGISYTQIIDAPGDYAFPELLPGLYILSCYRDENRDGRYSHGRVRPYRHAERFLVSRDTVKLRSRWPNEGNDLLLR